MKWCKVHLGLWSLLFFVACGSETKFGSSSPKADDPPAVDQDAKPKPTATPATVPGTPVSTEPPVWSLVNLPVQVRTEKLDKFLQDGIDAYVNQTLSAGESAKLDIGIIVDNSGSMEEEQTNLSTKLEALLSEVGFTDWRMAIVSTDPNDAPPTKPDWCTLLQKGDADLATRFRAAVSLGIKGSGNEQGLRRMSDLMTKECVPGGGQWYRPDSALVFLIVSDEDNCSNNGADCSDDPWGKPEFATKVLTDAGREPGVNSRIYGLVSDPLSPCSSAANQAVQYAAAIRSTQGVIGNICDTDYSAVLRRMSLDFAMLATHEFSLAHAPLPETLVVTINGERLGSSDYAIINNRVRVLGRDVVAGSEILVNYAWKLPESSMFALSSDSADPGTVSVKVNETVLQPAEWSLDGNRLTIQKVLYFRDVIEVSYFEQAVTTLRFSTEARNPVEAEVLVNGQKVGTELWHLSPNGTLVLEFVPPEGALVQLHYLH